MPADSSQSMTVYVQNNSPDQRLDSKPSLATRLKERYGSETIVVLQDDGAKATGTKPKK